MGIFTKTEEKIAGRIIKVLTYMKQIINQNIIIECFHIKDDEQFNTHLEIAVKNYNESLIKAERIILKLISLQHLNNKLENEEISILITEGLKKTRLNETRLESVSLTPLKHNMELIDNLISYVENNKVKFDVAA